MKQEEVVLVDDNNTVLGTMPKAEVHTANTPLHRGFSVFLFDEAGKVLLQQRSSHKKTWPLVWAGSCCGHPMLNESTEVAVRRRVAFELGITAVSNLEPILPDFRYSCVRDGIMENELCPVWVGHIDQTPNQNPQEVEAWEWKPWHEVVQQIRNHPGSYAQWCELEVLQLDALPLFHSYLATSNTAAN
jgi:isopentenyl-diphosphate Delta-isomerase